MNSETKATDSKTIKSEGTVVHLIAIDKLQELEGHAFKPYKGKKLEQLAQSIRDNGVMQPIIVRPIKDSEMFEIVSGHNRKQAAEQVGLTMIPAVVRELTENEAKILANETNITQRSFKDWFPSEKAKSIHQYHKAVKNQGKHSAKKADAVGGNSQKSDDYARTKTAQVYGVKGNIIRLYLDIHRLTDELMEKLDDEEFGVTAAQTISFISPPGQLLINSILEEDSDSYRITRGNSQDVRKALENYSAEDDDEIERVTSEVRKLLDVELFCASEPSLSNKKVKNIPIEADLYKEWFSDRPLEDAIEMLKAAMESYLTHDSQESDKTDEAPAFNYTPKTREKLNSNN